MLVSLSYILVLKEKGHLFQLAANLVISPVVLRFAPAAGPSGLDADRRQPARRDEDLILLDGTAVFLLPSAMSSELRQGREAVGTGRGRREAAGRRPPETAAPSSRFRDRRGVWRLEVI